MSVSLWSVQGWYRTNSEGISTIFLAITDEGFIGGPADDTPYANYKPRIINMETFSIRRQPMVWPMGDTSQNQNAAFAELEIDNYDGAFNFILRADLRNSKVVLQSPPARMFGGAAAGAPVVATAILDSADSNDEDKITIRLKDIIARLDKPLPMRFNPPFVDAGAANRMVPLTLGACRNVAPQLIDSTGNGTGMPIYLLHDQAITNITAVRDKGALLDVNADPPQYGPALNMCGLQLQTTPQGKLLVDCSSEGQQGAIPGIADVLAGVGELRSTTNPGPAGPGVTTWTGSAATNPPSGWTYTNPGGVYGTFGRLAYVNGYPQDWSMSMSTKRKFYTPGSDFGLPATLTTATLLPGKTYRISIVVDRCFFPNGDTTGAGLYLTTSPTTMQGGISGSPYGPYITAQSVGGVPYTFIYKAPNDGVTRTISVVGVGNPNYASPAQMVWHGLKAELLGQYIDLPMVGITLTDYYAEIFQRVDDDEVTWSVTDLNDLDDQAGYTFGNHYDEQPNTRTAITAPLDSFCATYFTDNFGVIRFRRLSDPRLGTPIALFDETNMRRPIDIQPLTLEYLTTLMGVRKNWSPPTDADFVSDFSAVPADVRERYKRTSQFQIYSTVTPAGEYSAAVGAPALESLLDLPEDGQTEIDRVIRIFAPLIYSDGSVANGKCQLVEFDTYFDSFTNFAGSTIGPHEMKWGDIVTLNYPSKGYNNAPMFVLGTELFPFAQTLKIMGFVKC